MTGKYPARLHTTNFFGGDRKGALLPPAYRQSLPHEDTTLAEAFAAAGYKTAISGKWHLGGKGSLPADHGFQAVFGATSKPAGGPPDDPHFATTLTTQAAAFIEQSKDAPFFLYLPFHSPHVGLKTRPELLEKYKAKAAALPPSAGPRDVPVAQGFKARAVQDHAVYAGMVQEMDEGVDRILRKLDELRLAERTIVVFLSDNGGLSTAEGSPTSNLPLRAGKGWNYEGGIRVPWIVRMPGRVAPGTTCDAPVITNDLYPTLLELAGVRVTRPASSRCSTGAEPCRIDPSTGITPTTATRAVVPAARSGSATGSSSSFSRTTTSNSMTSRRTPESRRISRRRSRNARRR
jgi:arylsulfatase A-like enzyme